MKVRIFTFLALVLFLGKDVFPCTITISNIKATAIYGRIIDEVEMPISGATVQIFKNADSNKILAEAMSDENGRFEIKDFQAGKYMIRAKAKNFAYTSSFLNLKSSSSKVKKKEMVFTLVPSSGCSGWVEMKKIQKQNNGREKN